VWEQLPRVEDYTDVATFDALFGHEVFQTAAGQYFQIDRQWTPEEEEYYRLQGSLDSLIQPEPNSGVGIRATVRTHHPVDEEYRGKFSTNSALKSFVIGVVETADNALYSNWNINFVASSGYRWDSNDGADIVGLLDEAYREGGGLNGKCMMIAFSADPTPGGAIGVAYIGLPRQLVKYYGSQSTQAAICQHETGHTYTLQHCQVSSCIMQSVLCSSCLGNFHNFYENYSGQNHYSVMNSQKNRYCP